MPQENTAQNYKERCLAISGAIGDLLQYKTTALFADSSGHFADLGINGIKIAQLAANTPEHFKNAGAQAIAEEELRAKVEALVPRPLGKIKDKLHAVLQDTLFPLQKDEAKEKIHREMLALIETIAAESGVEIGAAEGKTGDKTPAFRDR